MNLAWAQWQAWYGLDPTTSAVMVDPCPTGLTRTERSFKYRKRECKEQLCLVRTADEKSSTDFRYHCDETELTETLGSNKYCKYTIEQQRIYCPSM